MNRHDALQGFYMALFADDKEKARSFASSTYSYLGRDFDKQWDILAKEKAKGRYTDPKVEVLQFGQFFQVLLNGSLLDEEVFTFGIDNRLQGTASEIDCFGKLIFDNYQPARQLAIRVHKGESIKEVLLNGKALQCSQADTFADDGFNFCMFALKSDNFNTKEANVVIETNLRFSVQPVLLRGLDHVANSYKHPRLIKNGKGLKLNNDPLAIHRIEIETYGGKLLTQRYPTVEELVLPDIIKKVFVMAEGTAFNYLYSF